MLIVKTTKSIFTGRIILAKLILVSAFILITSSSVCLGFTEWSSVPFDYQVGQNISLDPVKLSPSKLGANAIGTITYYTTQTDFETAAPGLPVENFSGSNIGPNAICTDFTPLNSSTDDNCFPTGGLIDGFSLNLSDTNDDYAFLTTGFSGVPFDCIGPNTFTDDLYLDFNPTVTAVAFDLVGDVVGPVNVDIEIFGPGNTLIGTSTATGSLTGTFWGVVSPLPIERITLVGTGGSDGELIGNLQFGTIVNPVSIPTLSEWGMIILSLLLGAVSLYVLRKNRSNSNWA